ncbi:MAG TPA: hypothetical protein VKB93_09685 [Thermoanaerobaculia bacterium]|nr:hypothetical protein [Thermoanaerobaculia bacterium]
MRILSKSIATMFVLAAAACGSVTPWRNEPIGSEVNLAFTLEQNLVTFESVTIDGRTGRFVLGSAAPRTVIDPTFANPARQHVVQLAEKETLGITTAPLPLGGVADAIIGADAWHGHAISIDYHSGLVTYQKLPTDRSLMSAFPFQAEPAIDVRVNGQLVKAIVDTANPDTLILPGTTPERGMARVDIGGHDFGSVDVRYANVPQARVGNRLLSRFLVTIDYGRKVVNLWRDPRIPIP